MKNKVKPRFLGSGIYMTEQPWTQKPNKGDTVFDADFGELVWNGKAWIKTPPSTK